MTKISKKISSFKRINQKKKIHLEIYENSIVPIAIIPLKKLITIDKMLKIKKYLHLNLIPLNFFSILSIKNNF